MGQGVVEVAGLGMLPAAAAEVAAAQAAAEVAQLRPSAVVEQPHPVAGIGERQAAAQAALDQVSRFAATGHQHIHGRHPARIPVDPPLQLQLGRGRFFLHGLVPGPAEPELQQAVSEQDQLRRQHGQAEAGAGGGGKVEGEADSPDQVAGAQQGDHQHGRAAGGQGQGLLRPPGQAPGPERDGQGRGPRRRRRQARHRRHHQGRQQRQGGPEGDQHGGSEAGGGKGDQGMTPVRASCGSAACLTTAGMVDRMGGMEPRVRA